jgi:uncharacterized membrane protein YGL010W
MALLFRSAVDLLGEYASYHRDRRNIATHCLSVPMVLFALGVLLAGISFTVGGLPMSANWLLFALLGLWYLSRGHLGLGAATTLGVGALMGLAHEASGGTIGHWLAWWLGGFTAGWLIQFTGHYYEGRKPALADDLAGILTGPMFVMLELLAPLGLFEELAMEVERRAGPRRIRDLAQPAAR